MNKKEITLQAIARLKLAFPDAICSLDYTQPHELLIAVRLSAQCTDARVNIVTKQLFSAYPTLKALAEADIESISEIVRPCGLYKTKANDIKNMSIMLLNEYDGVLPPSIDELVKLPGIGRKSANLIMGDIYNQPAYVCDTHCIRITNLLGITTGKDPLKVEMQLRKLLPPEESNDFCHRMVLHGRATCVARKPQCSVCTLSDICKHAISSL